MRYFSVLLLAACTVAAADKKSLLGHYSNDMIDLDATAIPDLDGVHERLGRDVPDLVIVEIKIRVKTEKPLAIDLDDFTLRSDRNGERSHPYLPGQLAGKGALVVSRKLTGGSGMGRGNNGPGWGGGGIPGTMGSPQPLPDEGGGFGNTASHTTETKVTESESEKDKKENPLLAVLKAKIMPTGDIADATQGLLYFQMEGKHKIKDLELMYKGPAGRFQLRFKP
jgi:hypothetical protein